MSIIEDSPEITNVTYQVIESNFVWNTKGINGHQKSKNIDIPLINGQWYLNAYSNGILDFHLDIIKEDKVELSNEINSNKYQYLFEATWSGKKYGGTYYKDLLRNNHDTCRNSDGYSYPGATIKGKVSIRITPKVVSNLEIIRNKLCDDFNTLMLDSTYSDFTIIVAAKEFKVHKSVMSARSPVFMKMFESNMKEAADNKVEIIDVDPVVFEQLLIFIYSGKIPVNLDLYAMDLFVAADKYEVEDLKDLSEKHISLNVTMDNAMAVFNLANHYTCNYDLKKISLKFINEYLSLTSKGQLIFHMEDYQPMYCQYCFEVVVNGGTKSTQGFKITSNSITELHSVIISEEMIIEAKVTIKKPGPFNNLSFDNILKSLNDNLGEIMPDSIHSDFTIIVASKEFKVHKSVMSARSPVFMKMFESNMKEAADNKVEIIDVDPDVFEQLLIYIYSGKIADITYYAMDLFVAADKYGVQELRNDCEKRISIDLNNNQHDAIDVYKLANLYSCHELKKTSFEMIKQRIQKTVDVEMLEILLENEQGDKVEEKTILY
ncbi:unnamed protein product [Diamesa hyperborea]